MARKTKSLTSTLNAKLDALESTAADAQVASSALAEAAAQKAAEAAGARKHANAVGKALGVLEDAGVVI